MTDWSKLAVGGIATVKAAGLYGLWNLLIAEFARVPDPYVNTAIEAFTPMYIAVMAMCVLIDWRIWLNLSKRR